MKLTPNKITRSTDVEVDMGGLCGADNITNKKAKLCESNIF